MADPLVDLAAFRVPPSGPATHVLADVTSRGEVVTGEAKLAQRVLVELQTERQSLPFAPTRGTNLLTRLRSGRVHTEHDLFVAYSVAALDMARNLRGEEKATDDPSSRYAGSRLLSLQLGSPPGAAELVIEVTSRAGTKGVVRLTVNIKL